MQIWINLLTLIPSTLVTVLVITIAFLRFYDQNDFELLGFITNSRAWSNRLTVAALLAAMASSGVDWYRRNRETDRLAEEVQRRAKEEQRRAEEEQRRVAEQRTENDRRAEERERSARRDRIQARCYIAEIKYQLDPSEAHRQALSAMLAVLEEYGMI